MTPKDDAWNEAKHNGRVTVAFAAIVLKGGERKVKRAQWLKIFDVEEDRFYCVRPFLLVVDSKEVASRMIDAIGEMVESYKKNGLSYIGQLGYEKDSE